MKKYLMGFFLCMMLMAAGCENAKRDSNTLTVWHWMKDRHEAFEQLAARYKEQTGITVDFQLFVPSDIYSQKITAAAQARILPDIYGILDTKSAIAEFIKGGFVSNLESDFDANRSEWRSAFFEKALATNMFEEGNYYGVEPGIYGVPIDVTTIQMLYNKKILEQIGYSKPPKTFDDFIVYAQKVRALRVTPFVSGWNELWLIDCFAMNYAFNIMGKDKIMATYRGEVPYTDPDWIKVFSVIQTLIQQHVVDEGIVTKSNKSAELDFSLERAAFAFNGSWCVNVYHKMNSNLNYGVMMPPPVTEAHPLMIWGGAGSSFMVNEMSSNKKQAIAFLKWLTQKEQQIFLAEKTRNLSSNREAFAEADLPEELVKFGEGMGRSTHPTIWPLEEDVLVQEAFRKGLQSIIIGESTPEEIAQQVQEMKERQMKRKTRH